MWVLMNTHGYLNTRGYPHSGYPRGYGAGTGIIFIQRGRVSYYPYPWIPIDIPRSVSNMLCVVILGLQHVLLCFSQRWLVGATPTFLLIIPSYWRLIVWLKIVLASKSRCFASKSRCFSTFQVVWWWLMIVDDWVYSPTFKICVRVRLGSTQILCSRTFTLEVSIEPQISKPT